MTTVAFHRPVVTSGDARAVLGSLHRRRLGGDQATSRRVQRELARLLRVKYCLLTTSCTAALELACMALAVRPGDEIIMPSFSFPSAANAVLRAGGRPVFADIEPGTWNLDMEDARGRITRRTRAIMPVHYGGLSCDMERARSLASEHHLKIIEDAAQGIGAAYRGLALGAIGDVGCLSFHETKNVTSGEGGAFVTNQPGLFRRAEVLWEKGTDRAAFLRGTIDRYTWREVGGSFALADPLAALLGSQLRRLHGITAARARIAARYDALLRPLVEAGRLRLRRVPPHVTPNHHVYPVLVDPVRRTRILAAMRREGAEGASHFEPLHTSPFARRELGPIPSLPVTDRVAASLIRLPIYPGLGAASQARVVAALDRALRRSR